MVPAGRGEDIVTAERPSPVTDLDWDPERARAFADRAVDMWQEFLERLPDLPVSGRWTAKEIHDAVALDVPDEPMPDDALFAYLHDVIFEWSELSGHPRFMAYISGAGTVPGAVCRSAGRGAQRERRRVAALSGRDPRSSCISCGGSRPSCSGSPTAPAGSSCRAAPWPTSSA